MMSSNDILRSNLGIERVSNQLAVTNKLLQEIDQLLIPYRKGFKWGYCDRNKKIVIECKYDFVSRFRNGIAIVGKCGNNFNIHYGYINKSGNEITPCVYCNAKGFREGLAAVQINGKWGFINKLGELIIPYIYDSVHSFSEGLSLVRLDGKFGYVNKIGLQIVPFFYCYDADDFSNGLARVAQNSSHLDTVSLEHYYIDKTGKILQSEKVYAHDACEHPRYSNACNFSEGLAVVKGVVKYGFLDLTGKLAIPYVFDIAFSFYGGLAKVCKNKKVGFINKSGELVIGYKYDWASDFSEGLAAVKSNDKWGFIDKTGKIVVALKYDQAYEFSDGLALVINKSEVKSEMRFVFINKNGDEVLHLDSNKVVGYWMKNGQWTFYGRRKYPLWPSYNPGYFLDGLYWYDDYCAIDKNGRQYWED